MTDTGRLRRFLLNLVRIPFGHRQIRPGSKGGIDVKEGLRRDTRLMVDSIRLSERRFPQCDRAARVFVNNDERNGRERDGGATGVLRPSEQTHSRFAAGRVLPSCRKTIVAAARRLSAESSSAGTVVVSVRTNSAMLHQAGCWYSTITFPPGSRNRALISGASAPMDLASIGHNRVHRRRDAVSRAGWPATAQFTLQASRTRQAPHCRNLVLSPCCHYSRAWGFPRL